MQRVNGSMLRALVVRLAVVVPMSIGSVSGNSVFAQIRPTTVEPLRLTDESTPLVDRGSRLDVYEGVRVTFDTRTSRRQVIASVAHGSPESPLGKASMGVVFNHDTRQYGYANGEIAFKLKADASGGPSWFGDFVPKVKKLGRLNLYVVTAATMREFVRATQQLQQNPEVEWVEPTIVYGAPPVASNPSTK